MGTLRIEKTFFSSLSYFFISTLAAFAIFENPEAIQFLLARIEIAVFDSLSFFVLLFTALVVFLTWHGFTSKKRLWFAGVFSASLILLIGGIVIANISWDEIFFTSIYVSVIMLFAGVFLSWMFRKHLWK